MIYGLTFRNAHSKCIFKWQSGWVNLSFTFIKALVSVDILIVQDCCFANVYIGFMFTTLLNLILDWY